LKIPITFDLSRKKKVACITASNLFKFTQQILALRRLSLILIWLLLMLAFLIGLLTLRWLLTLLMLATSIALTRASGLSGALPGRFAWLVLHVLLV
jgi:hypothetical protein